MLFAQVQGGYLQCDSQMQVANDGSVTHINGEPLDDQHRQVDEI